MIQSARPQSRSLGTDVRTDRHSIVITGLWSASWINKQFLNIKLEKQKKTPVYFTHDNNNLISLYDNIKYTPFILEDHFHL